MNKMKKHTSNFWIWVGVLFSVLLALIVINIVVRLPKAEEQPALESTVESPIVTGEVEGAPSTEITDDQDKQETDSEQKMTSTDAENMQKVIRDITDNSAGTWSVYYESLSASSYGDHTDVNGSNSMVSASLIKLFIMGAVYQDIEAGLLSHDAVYSDIYSMITVSDNDAANRLVRNLGDGDAAVGMEKVNSFASSVGCSQSVQKRLMLDNNGLQNYVSARDCGVLLRMIYEGRCVTKDWSDEMMSCLKAQTVNNRLPAQLPAGTVVAHKTGDLSNLSCGDVGIIITQQGSYILCVINNQSPNDAQTAQDIANLSARVYEQFTNGGVR